MFYGKQDTIHTKSPPMFILQYNSPRASNGLKEIDVHLALIDTKNELFKEESLRLNKISKTNNIDQQIFKLSSKLFKKGYDIDIRPVLEEKNRYFWYDVHDGYFIMHSKKSLKRGDLSLKLLSAFYCGIEKLPDLKRICEETDDGNRIIWEDNSQHFPLEQFYNDIQNHPSPSLSKVSFLNTDNNGELFENLTIKKEMNEVPNSYSHIVTYHCLPIKYLLPPKFIDDLNVVKKFKTLVQ